MLRKDKTTPNRFYDFEFHVQLLFLMLTNVAINHGSFRALCSRQRFGFSGVTRIYESDLQV